MKEAISELEKDFKKAVKKINFSSYDPYSREFMKPLFIGQLYLAMKAVYEDDVQEELDGAAKYWNTYLETEDTAYKDMAQDELRHAGVLIKKHLAGADEEYRKQLNAHEKERQEMLKVISAQKTEV